MQKKMIATLFHVLHCSNFFCLGGIKACQGRKLNCALELVRSMGSEQDPVMTKAHNSNQKLLRCEQRCEFQYEAVLSSSSGWPSELFYYRTDYCYILQKLQRICNDSIRDK